MNQHISRLESLRKLMKEHGIHYYMIPTADFHNSEYVHDYFKCREFMSGFTGSNGTLVVSETEARLWTDGRYFIQCEKEIEGSGIMMMKMAEAGVPTITEYLQKEMKPGEVIGFDGRCVDVSAYLNFQDKLKDISYKMDLDLVDELWTDRPTLPATALFYIPDEIAGLSIQEKLNQVREKLGECDGIFLSKLDDIMWLFNVRANDVECNPVALSYSYVSKDKAVLFIQRSADISRVSDALTKAGVEICAYEEAFTYLEGLKGNQILLDKSATSAMVASKLEKDNTLEYGENPTVLLKAVKNATEIEHMRKYYLQDSLALTKFIYWLKQYPNKEELDECMVAEKLDAMRAEIPGFIELSFPTISAYQANAAMMHYEATKEDHANLKAEGFYLVDSGGQYMGATTDVTRTISLGALTENQKRHYTKTAAGMLELSDAQWLYGCTGRNLDILARTRLWKEGIDYKCGTGHGIGYILNVHEGPQNIRWKYTGNMKEAVIEAGMVVSNEPGVYIEGEYGIRIENILLTHNTISNEYGQFMNFENLTFVPLDRDALDVKYMSNEDVERVNAYQKTVLDALSPYLSEKEQNWLKNECSPL